ncbi:class I SAM-dependent methyltransferase, partial [Acinetobacter baumannii]
YLRPFAPKQILDIATGTGDLAIQLQRQLHPDHIIGADLSEGMMEEGRQKVEKAGLSAHITFERQDCTALTYEDNRFDAVTAAFGVRNF